MSNRGLLPETGYARFLENQKRRRDTQQRFVAEALVRELLGDTLDGSDGHGDDMTRTLMHAANHVLIVLETDGWDLMFDANGHFKGVVT